MRLLVTVTLNPNQFRSHVEPITALPEVESVTLVSDAPGPPMPKLRTIVPPRRMVRVLGRAAAKLVTGLRVAARERPAWVLGYNLVPHGINAVAIARLVGARSYVHVIGGPAEWEGGGHGSDNKVLSRLPRPVPVIERALLAVLRRADVVAVMGTDARRRLIAAGVVPERIVVLPASVPEPTACPAGDAPRYDVVCASQLIGRKRLGELLEALAIVRRERPGLRAMIAGRGPLAEELREHARRLGLADAVEFPGFVSDVAGVYAEARVFALPSQREGLSIAMTEAMAAGVPVVVTDIGEARDVVEHGRTGFLFAVGDVEAMARDIGLLLGDEALRARMGRAAAEAVRASSSPERITALNRRALLGP